MNATFCRIMATSLSVVLVAQSAGCGTAPTKEEMQSECGEGAARVLSESSDQTGVRQAVFEYATREQPRCAIAAPPRRYLVSVDVEWSNGWVEHDEVTTNLSAEPGQRYSVLAYEKGKGQVPVRKVTLGGYVSTPAKVVILIAAAPIVVLLAPIWLVALPFSGRKAKDHAPTSGQSKPTDRPATDCCFIWLVHGSTGEVVAGTAPRQ